MLEGRGGETIIITHCNSTPKAFFQYEEFYQGWSKDQLCQAFIGVEVRRFADNSPYFICESEELRFVFCVEKRKKESSGRMCLVTVQQRFKK